MFRGLHENQLGEAEYFGPPRGGQSYQMYNEFMSMPIATTSGVVVGALIAGPIGAIAGGIAGWAFSGGDHSNKPKIQGG